MFAVRILWYDCSVFRKSRIYAKKDGVLKRNPIANDKELCAVYAVKCADNAVNFPLIVIFPLIHEKTVGMVEYAPE